MTRHWGFRGRLTALIAGVFILGGAVLLTVQYVLVQQLFASGIATISTGCLSDVDWTSLGEADAARAAAEEALVPCGDDILIGSDGAIRIHELSIQQTSFLSQEVLSGMLGWSVVVLVVFAGVAVLAARWLSQRSLGRIAHITATTREITRDDLHRRLDLPGPVDEVKELGDTIDGMLDRLEDAFTRQERFVAAASHELRTPLTTTRTALEIPLEQGRFGTEVEPAVRRALAANARSERLIGALLTLARASGDPAPTGGTADLTALVHDALAERASEAFARGISPVVMRAAGDDPSASQVSSRPTPGEGDATPTGASAGVLVTADPTLVAMLVGNLVENAVRHNVDGGRLLIELAASGGQAVLTVSNDGPVLSAAETALLTEPFHRGDRTRLAGPGAGLGLTLAETLTRRLGGSLMLAPRPAGGLVVRLTLPAARS